MYKKSPKLKKNTENQIYLREKFLKNWILLGILKRLKPEFFFESLSFWLWKNLNFPVWTYSEINCCCYKFNKRNLSLIKAMLFKIQNYILFMEHASSCFDVLTLVCNWWWKLFTNVPSWMQTLRGCPANLYH